LVLLLKGRRAFGKRVAFCTSDKECPPAPFVIQVAIRSFL